MSKDHIDQIVSELIEMWGGTPPPSLNLNNNNPGTRRNKSRMIEPAQRLQHGVTKMTKEIDFADDSIVTKRTGNRSNGGDIIWMRAKSLPMTFHPLTGPDALCVYESKWDDDLRRSRRAHPDDEDIKTEYAFKALVKDGKDYSVKILVAGKQLIGAIKQVVQTARKLNSGHVLIEAEASGSGMSTRYQAGAVGTISLAQLNAHQKELDAIDVKGVIDRLLDGPTSKNDSPTKTERAINQHVEDMILGELNKSA